jgi:hypothetical protein
MLNPVVRKIFLVVAALILLALAWTGLTQGVNQMPHSHTPGEIAQTLSQFVFGIFALLSLATTFRARRWNTLMLGGLIVSLALAAGLASVFWGRTSILIGLVSGGAALLIGLGIAALLRAGARGLSGNALA